MAYIVETDQGVTVDTGTHGQDNTEEQAKASMDRRNIEAERLGLTARYRIRADA